MSSVTCARWHVRWRRAITGLALSTEEFMRIGERIRNLERVFNVAEGFRLKDDYFPIVPGILIFVGGVLIVLAGKVRPAPVAT